MCGIDLQSGLLLPGLHFLDSLPIEFHHLAQERIAGIGNGGRCGPLLVRLPLALIRSLLAKRSQLRFDLHQAINQALLCGQESHDSAWFSINGQSKLTFAQRTQLLEHSVPVGQESGKLLGIRHVRFHAQASPLIWFLQRSEPVQQRRPLLTAVTCGGSKIRIFADTFHH